MIPVRLQRRILLIALPVTLLTVFAWFALRPHEPIYQGKTLSAWLEQYWHNSGNVMLPYAPDLRPRDLDVRVRDSAQAALLHIGTNGIPHYLDLMSRPPDSAFKTFLRFALAKLPGVTPPLSAGDCRVRGYMGLQALGSNAAPAVPRLIELLTAPEDPIRLCAAGALGYVGPAASNAVPSLINRLQDTNWVVGFYSIYALRNIHSRPELTVPALTGVLDPTNLARNRDTCYLALSGLAEFGPAAKPAVPLILPCLQDRDAGVRVQATNALKKIDPAAAATAGIHQ
jgi:hypothetical protein